MNVQFLDLNAQYNSIKKDIDNVIKNTEETYNIYPDLSEEQIKYLFDSIKDFENDNL